jgi:hypothetical protein
MKKRIVSVFILISLLASTGCKKFVEGYDESPNSPSAVTPQLLLSNAEVAYFSTMNGQLSRQSAMLTQQVVGLEFQAKDVNDYQIDENTNGNEWAVIYTNGLVNLRQLYNQAGSGNPYYQGMARVLQAMFLGTASDLWGDVPNTEAVNGLEGIVNPKYDKQEDVIKDIQAYLSEAITLFEKAEGDNKILPADDDLIYAGDVAAWKAAASVLKARYHNRLSKRDAAGSADNALTALTAAYAAGFTSNDANCNANFGVNSNEYNQWYAYTQVDRRGYIRMGSMITDTMNAMSDPRLSFYAQEDDSSKYTGTDVDEGNTTVSDIGAYLATQNAPFPLISYAEAKFIEAEAKLRKSDAAGAAAAFNDAVKASVEQVTGAAADAAYVTAYASETAGSISLEKIMWQKYLSLFGQIEVYNDWRRTGFPKLKVNSNANDPIVPRRIPTVLDERLYNANAPKITDIRTTVWWDN